MAIRPLVKLPDAQLRVTSAPVGEVTDEIRALASDMLDTMYDAPGIGLAAIQIGVPKRPVVLDLGNTGGARRPVWPFQPENVAVADVAPLHAGGCLSVLA